MIEMGEVHNVSKSLVFDSREWPTSGEGKIEIRINKKSGAEGNSPFQSITKKEEENVKMTARNEKDVEEKR